MNKIFKALFTILIFSTSHIYSQITITQADFNALFPIGASENSFADTNVVSVNIGNPGGNNTWDFSGYVPDFTMTINYISPAGTPVATAFPSSNVVGYFTRTFMSDDTTTITSESWSYYSTGTPSLEYGSYSENNFVTPNTQGTIETAIIHYPPFNEYDFPVTFTKTWSRTDSTETESSFNGVPTGFVSVIKSVINYNIDAWGTLMLPDGGSYPALRLREDETSTTYFSGFPISTIMSTTYSFITKTGESFSVLADMVNPPNSGSIMGTIGWSDNSVTDVEEITGITPTEFSLSQNYPNPFNPSTLIEYSLTTESFVDLKVYDILGNEVAVLVNEEQNAGTYRANFNAAGLASGLYIAKINAGNFTQSIKMTLLK
jgi:type IX secretion system substrate protein